MSHGPLNILRHFCACGDACRQSSQLVEKLPFRNIQRTEGQTLSLVTNCSQGDSNSGL